MGRVPGDAAVEERTLMGWLLRHNWIWSLIAFLVGAAITWFLLTRRQQAVRTAAKQQAAAKSARPAESSEREDALVGAGVTTTTTTHTTPSPHASHPAATPDAEDLAATQAAAVREAEEAAAARAAEEVAAAKAAAQRAAEEAAAQGGVAAEGRGYSQRMVAEPTLFDEPDDDEAQDQAPAGDTAPPTAAGLTGTAAAEEADNRAATSPAAENQQPAEQPSADTTSASSTSAGATPATSADATSAEMAGAGAGSDAATFAGKAAGEGVVPGRHGEGSADAVQHQGPPDGFTIKGNAQSMLFHTPGSPYYGRTKPEVWFRTEADAERAGFTKYIRKPRKSPDPRA